MANFIKIDSYSLEFKYALIKSIRLLIIKKTINENPTIFNKSMFPLLRTWSMKYIVNRGKGSSNNEETTISAPSRILIRGYDKKLILRSCINSFFSFLRIKVLKRILDFYINISEAFNVYWISIIFGIIT